MNIHSSSITSCQWHQRSNRVRTDAVVRSRSEGKLWFLAWAAFTLGGALCSVFSLGVFTVVFFFLSAPLGALLGFALGAFLSPLVTVVIVRFASPPRSVRQLVLSLELTGVIIANVLTAPLLIAMLSSDQAVSPSPWLLVNTLCGLIAVTLTGRGCGRLLAIAHLRACGIVPPRSRLRLHRPVRSRQTQTTLELGAPTSAKARSIKP